MKPRTSSPVVGYNTGVQYGGKTYHIQTEDSGREHPHVITHLFADGGRVIATRRTSYAEYLNTERCAAMVKEIVLAQHKAMFVALRDGRYDAILAPSPEARSPRSEPALDVGELDRALERAQRPSLPGAPSPPAVVDAPIVAAKKPERPEPALPHSAPPIHLTDPTEVTIDEVILAELTAFLADE